MKKEKDQDIYSELTQDLKNEKMDWDFEQFLEKAEPKDNIIPLKTEPKGGSISKRYWLAASVILLLTVGICLKYTTGNDAQDKDIFVKNQILKEKVNFDKESQFAINNTVDSAKIKRDSIIADSSATVEQVKESDILDQILPRRGRFRKNSRERFAAVSVPQKTKSASNKNNSDYESNYVIINGQKIENEQEAIDLTKYSFRILSENVSKTMAQTDVINTINNDY